MKRHVCRTILFPLFFAIAQVTSGCGKESSDYPSVALIHFPNDEGWCSGTFVSPRAVMTASHCTPKEGSYAVNTSFGSFETESVVKFGPGTNADANDIAFLIFDQDVASGDQIMALGDKVSIGETIRIVGFGCDDAGSQQGGGVKRSGENVINAIAEFLEINTPTPGAAPGPQIATRGIISSTQAAGACSGDSGGPAASVSGTGNLRMVGITHAAGSNGEKILSEYVDITRADNREFISQVNRDRQLNIPGF